MTRHLAEEAGGEGLQEAGDHVPPEGPDEGGPPEGFGRQPIRPNAEGGQMTGPPRLVMGIRGIDLETLKKDSGGST